MKRSAVDDGAVARVSNRDKVIQDVRYEPENKHGAGESTVVRDGVGANGVQR